MSIVAERYGLCHKFREVSPTLSVLRHSQLLSRPHRQPPDADHMSGYCGPGGAQAGPVRQPQPRVERINGEAVLMLLAAARARRVVTCGPGTILCLPRPRRQPILRVLREVGGARADVEHDPVDIRRNRSLTVVHHDRERLRLLRQSLRPIKRRTDAGPETGVLKGQRHVGPELRAGHGDRLGSDKTRAAQAAEQAAAAEQRRQRGQDRQYGKLATARAAAPSPDQVTKARSTYQAL